MPPSPVNWNVFWFRTESHHTKSESFVLVPNWVCWSSVVNIVKLSLYYCLTLNYLVSLGNVGQHLNRKTLDSYSCPRLLVDTLFTTRYNEQFITFATPRIRKDPSKNNVLINLRMTKTMQIRTRKKWQNKSKEEKEGNGNRVKKRVKKNTIFFNNSIEKRRKLQKFIFNNCLNFKRVNSMRKVNSTNMIYKHF